MAAIASLLTNRHSSCVRNQLDRNWLAYWVFMGRREDIKKLWDRKELTFNQKLDAYLDGLMMSFDFYPVCNKRFFKESDMASLLEDFWAVGADLNKGVQELIDEPRGDREREQRAAKRALEAIKRYHTQRSSK